MRRILGWVSDFHIYSRYAIMPPRMITPEGIEIGYGLGQKAIWDYYTSTFIPIFEAKGVDTILVTGDVLHGQNPIEMGTMIVSPNMDEQVDAAVEILDLLVYRKDLPRRKLYMFCGSRYHRSLRGHHPEKDVCDRLGGVWKGPMKNMKFPPSERVFNIAHGESAAYIYREMILGREILFAKSAEGLGKIKKIDAFVRGHWHTFIHLHEKKIHFFLVPGWMAYEPSRPYLQSYGKMQPEIGGVITFIDDEDRIDVKHYLMPEIPHIVDEIEEG